MKIKANYIEPIGENERSNSALGGALSLTLSAILVKLLGLLYKIPLANILGEEGMGYFNSAYTVYGLFYLLCTAGVPKAVTMLIVKAKEGRGVFTCEKIMKTAIAAFFGLSAVITLLFVLLSDPISSFIGNSRAKTTMIAVAPSIIFVSLAGVIRGYMTAEMKLLSVSISQIVESAGKLVFGLIFARRAAEIGLPPEMISAFTILGVSIGSALGFLYLAFASKFSFLCKKSGQSFENSSKLNILKEIFKISLPITVSAAVMSITNIIDLTVTMRALIRIGYSAEEATALYGNYTTLAVPMFNLAVSLITPISVAYLPVFVKSSIASDREKEGQSLKSALSFSAFLSAPIFIGIIVFSKEILALIFGNMGISIGAPLLCLLMPSFAFMSILLIVNSKLESVGDLKAPIISMIIGSALKMLVGGFFLSNSDFGISGAPIGTVICYAAALITSLIIAEKKHSISFPIFTTHVIPYLNSALSVLIGRIVYNKILLTFSSNAALIITIGVCALIYAIMSVLSGAMSVKKIKKLAKYTKV